LIALLSAIALASAALHIRAEFRGPRSHVYAFKPLTTGCLLAIALVGEPIDPLYRNLIVMGLAFSLSGDVFLMLPSDRFLAGLASFFVAHLCYIAAFLSTTGPHLSPAILIPWLVAGAGFVAALGPHFGSLRAPAVLYVLAIATMGWQATEQWYAARQDWTVYALVGAVLFVVSDSALALNRFRRPFRAAPLVILSTYYTAQYLIALSTHD
jgi:uncharacterized membrane protein YhhN